MSIVYPYDQDSFPAVNDGDLAPHTWANDVQNAIQALEEAALRLGMLNGDLSYEALRGSLNTKPWNALLMGLGFCEFTGVTYAPTMAVSPIRIGSHIYLRAVRELPESGYFDSLVKVHAVTLQQEAVLPFPADVQDDQRCNMVYYGDYLYVPMVYRPTYDYRLYRIRLSDFSIVDYVSLGISPIAMMVDGTYLYVLHTNRSVNKYDLATLTQQASLTLSGFYQFGSAQTLALDKDYLYVSHPGAYFDSQPSQMARISLATFASPDYLTFPSGSGEFASYVRMAYDGEKTLYVVRDRLDPSVVTVYQVDRETFTIGTSLDITPAVTHAVVFDGKSLYVKGSDLSDNWAIYRIDLDSFTEVGSLSLGNHHYASWGDMSTDGLFLYAASNSDSSFTSLVGVYRALGRHIGL
jgi:hypothetical protein